ncbi:4150_t:CDS:2 [Acaulospora colombiana]|uniref:4150_t:CDS:1 n=1 Tax=Acaulospora colombiana TaxID=27376 RepID=A0ACA9MR10_9GLOM|nr:4150_t:CDS:2 [Acaulospora colombiana]
MSSELFSPIRVGRLDLAHRVVLAPLTRCRADSAHVHGDLAVTYYEQRASVPGTLLITEATFIAPEASGLNGVPGIWSREQIAAWKKVTDAVHAKGSIIYLQLWALGRQANPKALEKEGGYPYVSSSDVPMQGKPKPRPLFKFEVEKYVDLYAKAAENAIEFIQDVCNTRTDEYGGSIENRARFALEVTKAVTAAVDMRMKDPIPTFEYLIQELHDGFPQLAYIHLVEPRIAGDKDGREKDPEIKVDSNDFAKRIWGERPYISAGGYTPESAVKRPDLPERIKRGVPLNEPNRKTFYTPGPIGYTDYSFLEETPNSTQGLGAILGGEWWREQVEKPGAPQAQSKGTRSLETALQGLHQKMEIQTVTRMALERFSDGPAQSQVGKSSTTNPVGNFLPQPSLWAGYTRLNESAPWHDHLTDRIHRQEIRLYPQSSKVHFSEKTTKLLPLRHLIGKKAILKSVTEQSRRVYSISTDIRMIVAGLSTDDVRMNEYSAVESVRKNQ